MALEPRGERASRPDEAYQHSILICVDCGEEFVFTASAQKYFMERGFLDPPKRCRTCYGEFKDSDGSDEPPPTTKMPGEDG